MDLRKFWKEEIITLNKASLLLIVLPYIGFNWQELSQSPFFSYTKLYYLITIMIGADLLFKSLLLTKSKYAVLTNILISSFIIVFFYANYIVDPIFNLFNKKWDIIIRGRTIVFFSLLFTLSVQLYYVYRKQYNYLYFNIFLLIFSMVTFVFKHNPNKNIYYDKFTSNSSIKFNKFHHVSDTNKPLLLIITDEYNSPDNLYALTKDSSVYEYSTQLKKNGWIVNNHFYSYEISTIHSIASLMNFNLSKNKGFHELDMAHIGANQLKKSLLIDSLKNKQIEFVNFGIFDINDHISYSNIYIYPKNFTEHFLLYSCYLLGKRSSIKFHGKKLSGKNEIIMEHNKYFIYNLNKEMKRLKTNSFIYVHLFMPHAPLQFEPEFKRKELKNLDDYVEYWKFSNIKLAVLLDQLRSENKYRIIVTGDHGLRGIPTDPHHTFSAFYGFDSVTVNQIKSVQDIGSLINSSF